MLCYNGFAVIKRGKNMEEDLITKKEILEITGISYGQLYRWKRKSLIPEEWFIKRSSYTGQETYFPKDKILNRINKIKNMKEDLSLDDIAEVFSPQLSEIKIYKENLVKENIVSLNSVNIFENINGDTKVFNFENILFLLIIHNFLKSGNISFEEGKTILGALQHNYKFFTNKDCDVLFVRKFGVGICILLSSKSEIFVEQEAKLVQKINVSGCIEEIKSKINIM